MSKVKAISINCEYGYTLLEVIIAFLIISVAFASITIFSIKILSHMQKVEVQSIAVLELNNVAERFNAGDFDCKSWRLEVAQLLLGSDAQCELIKDFYEFTVCFFGNLGRKECIKLHLRRK